MDSLVQARLGKSASGRFVLYSRSLSDVAYGIIVKAGIVSLVVYGIAASEEWHAVAVLAPAALLASISLLISLIELMPSRRPSIWMEDDTVKIRSGVRLVTFELQSMKVRVQSWFGIFGFATIENRSNRATFGLFEFPREVFCALSELTAAR